MTPRQQLLRGCELFIADIVAEFLAANGIGGIQASDLADDPELRLRDFALLGLGSLDWMALATRVEAGAGAELDDEALINPERRCIVGWSRSLAGAGAIISSRSDGSRHPGSDV